MNLSALRLAPPLEEVEALFGSRPARIHPRVVQVLRAKGVDVEGLQRLARERLDDEALGFARLARRAMWARLQQLGWALEAPAPDGLGRWSHGLRRLTLMHSVARELDGEVWAHLSLSRHDLGSMPRWSQVSELHRLFYPDLVGLVVLPPAAEHVSIAEVAHAWVCLTRRPTPDFSNGLGSI